MGKQNKFDMNKVAKSVRTQLEVALTFMGNEARNTFKQNFVDGGFTDVNLQKWKPRKDNSSKKSAGRAVLVKSGDLKRSIIRRSVNKSNLSVVISTDKVYAAIHNNGGIIDKKAHKRTATITRTIRGNSGFVNGKFTKGRGKKVTFQGERHNVSASVYKMPKRQFIGNSYQMNERIKKILVTRLNNHFSK